MLASEKKRKSEWKKEESVDKNASSRSAHFDEYLVEITVAGRSRKVIWNTEEPLELNHPVRYLLEYSGGLRVRDLQGDIHSIEPSELIEVDHIRVRVIPLTRARDGLLPSGNVAKRGISKYDPTELFASGGVGDLLSSFDALGSRYYGLIEGRRVFNASRAGSSTQVTSYIQGVTIELAGKAPIALQVGVASLLEERDLETAVIRIGQYWWRISRIATPATPDIDVRTVDEVDTEALFLKRVTHLIATTWIAVVFSLWLNPLPKELRVNPPKEEPKPSLVQLKKPKIIAKKPEPPKPVVAKKPEPKPEPKKVAQHKPEKKVVKKEVAKIPPKQKAAPAPKVAQKIPRKPVPIPIKKPPVQQVVVAKPQPVKAPPVIAQRPVVPKPVKPAGPTPEQIRAAAQAKLAKSLGFLSAAPNKISNRQIALAEKTNPDARYQVMGDAPVAKTNNSVLLAMAKSAGGASSPIDTTASRNISSDAGVEGGYGAGGKGKALNEVQGKVSLAALYDPNSGEGMGNALGGQGGLTMSGEGSIPESLILKILSKYLQKFQYCYEKALLNSPSLAGNLTMQWTIVPGGKATSIKAVRSQLNHEGLHGCVAGELGKIPFPSPSGGSVTIKYPFSFSSSSL